MKRFILLLLAFVLIVAITGCSKKPVSNNGNDVETPGLTLSREGEEALSELQEKISADGKLLGVAYLGFIDYDTKFDMEEFKKQEHIKALPLIENIYEYAENEGYRIYAIVPADNQVTITVCKCEFGEEYLPYDGEELIKANGPILVRGNVSDTIPNLYVVAKKGSEKVEYTPVQSGMDGRLENSEDKVYDFTPYNYMAEFSAYDRVPDAVFCGSWIAFENDGNGEERALVLELNPDGTVSYAYGLGNSEILEKFEGTWTLDENDILKLELEGGPPESVENPVVAEPYDCNPSFEWEMTAEGLSLTHIDGDEILYGTKGNTFEFYVNEY
mgnify:FL=1